MASRTYLWLQECEICMEDVYDCFFINCGICKNFLCKSCYQRLSQKKCPFCRSSMEVRQPRTLYGNRSARSSLIQSPHMTAMSQENFLRTLGRHGGYSVINLFTNIPVSNMEAICDIMKTGYFDDALSNGGKCRCLAFANRYVLRQLEKIVVNSEID